MNIIGKPECTASQMAQYLISKNSNAKSWALEYAQLYLEEGEAEGVRGDGAWIQSCKETGNFKFSGGTAVTFDQNNFCGLGVTRKGLKGHSFDTPRLGIRAQIQHLKGYATTAPLKNPCIDPRYKYISKGCAPRFEDLAGRWAVPGYDTSKASSLQDALNKGIGYGFDIIAGIEQMKKIVISNSPTKDNDTNNTGNKEENNMSSPVIALSAGHGLYTAGKRCMKAIDPNETREWYLNDRIVDKVENKLKAYNCIVIRVNDTTGKVDASARTRANVSNNANADVYIAVHHDAGKNGRKGGGTTVFWYSSAPSRGQEAQRFYNYVVKETGLVGDRSSKVIKKGFDELRLPNAPAFLIENGFMDSVDDVPVILTEDHAEKTANGIVSFLVDYLKLTKNGNVVSTTPVAKPSTPASTTTYEVQKHDTLSKIGAKTGVAWKTIADLNGIKFPYVVRVGQVLKLTNISASTATSNTSSTKYTYNGVDYSLVFDPTYYASKYSDLKKAFGTNSTALFNHFKVYGMREGRIAKVNFNVIAYKNRYTDLQKAFGNNLPDYYKHYCQFGAKEGRSAL